VPPLAPPAAGPDTSHDILVRRVRPVPLATRAGRGAQAGAVAGGADLLDVRISGGVVADVGPRLDRLGGEQVLEGAGRWALPGLWDAHVHLGQWARSRRQLDVGGTASPDDVVRRVAQHVRALPSGRPASVVLGQGYRSAAWQRPPTVSELDAVSGEHPVVLISGDAHNGWLNSAALHLLGLGARPGPLLEDEWFPVLGRLSHLTSEQERVQAYREALADAASRGVVGVVDMEFGSSPLLWRERAAGGTLPLRVQAACYPDTLDDVLAAGLRAGQELPGTGGLVTTGPLKVIYDGSLNTATAWCCEPYRTAGPGGSSTCGQLNLAPEELLGLLRRAHRHGLRAAVHAIGDAAVTSALDAMAAAGARGSIEHVQLVARADLPRFAQLGVTASVQPAHLLDDRDVTAELWPDRQDRCFALRSLLDAGAELALGSDAPVAALDPWLALAAAVHRSADDRPPWNPREHLGAAQALAASTGGQGTLRPGSTGDVVLVDADPLAAQSDSATTAAHLRAVPVAATLVGGRITHLAT
jgi:predicted amidohydrolase YtcJ